MLESEQGAGNGTQDQTRTTTTPPGTTRQTTGQKDQNEGGSTAGGAGSKPAGVPGVAFQPPPVLFQPPDLPAQPEPDEDESVTKRGRRRRSRSRDADDQAAPAAEAGRADDSAEAGESGRATDPSGQDDTGEPPQEGGSRRRRRRRGGRRRNRAETEGEAQETDADRSGAEESKEGQAASAGSDRSGKEQDTEQKQQEATQPTAAEDASAASGEAGTGRSEATGGESATTTTETTTTTTSGSRRRRRRRRRRGEPVEPAPDDPETTVVKVREPRKPEKAEPTAVSSVEGSTRLEAKKQRRREGREAGRRRPTILTESEFLARRESVERSMVIRQRGDVTQIAVLEDKVLVEHYVAKRTQTSMIGNVYLGRVQNVLPSMEAAFIDIGRGRNAVLYAGEVDWAGLGVDGQPKRIESALKSGQTVLVQVTKDPVGHKGARLTSQISLPGRYLVYVPHGTMNGISRKLPDTERSRLKQLLKDIVAEDAGVVVRTAAEGASEEELSRDVARLRAQWESIVKQSETAKAPQLLYQEPDLLIKVVRDLFTEDFSRLVVSGDEAWEMVQGYVGHVAPHLSDRLERWTSPEDVFAAFRIDEQIVKALDRKVWLPSGGSLIIERTEAMTVVDVNTGKFTGSGGNLEETVTKNNLEAAEELVRQLRLRDIGGIIVVDFIDMVLESNRELVLRRLVECLGRDRTKHQVAEVTSLGLVQMTRKRIGTGLLESFSEPCEACKGRGHIINLDLLEGSGDSGKGASNGKRGGADTAHKNGASASGGSPSGEEGSSRRSRRRRSRSGGGDSPNGAQAAEQTEGSGGSDQTDPAEDRTAEHTGSASTASGERTDTTEARGAEAPAQAEKAGTPGADTSGTAEGSTTGTVETDAGAARADNGVAPVRPAAEALADAEDLEDTDEDVGPDDATDEDPTDDEETPTVRADKDYASVSESLEPSVEPVETKGRTLTAASFSSTTRPRRRF